jgi:hypothetical protein
VVTAAQLPKQSVQSKDKNGPIQRGTSILCSFWRISYYTVEVRSAMVYVLATANYQVPKVPDRSLETDSGNRR